MLRRLPLLTLALALALPLAGCAESSVTPAVEPAPPVRKGFLRVPLTTVDGESTGLARAADGQVVVLAIAVGDDLEAVDAFSKKHGFPFTRLLDNDYALANGLGTNRVPTTLVIDRDGSILHQGGALDRVALAALRNALP